MYTGRSLHYTTVLLIRAILCFDIRQEISSMLRLRGVANRPFHAKLDNKTAITRNAHRDIVDRDV